MRFIREFKLYLESIDNIRTYNGWIIKYNHTKHHDLNKKLIERSLIKDTSHFDKIIVKIINRCVEKSLNGDVIFFDFRNQFKILINIGMNILYVITFLSKDQEVKGIKNYEII
jgi:uncharacterized protein YfaT (DUF1175 family)